MKGVILTINPDVCLVDITHEIEPQNTLQGSIVLAKTVAFLPPATIVVAVVDPGVGTERGIVCAESGGRRFVAPDNGLLTGVLRNQPLEHAVRITAEQHFRHPVSSTFHARDIMAAVAAHLSLGVAIGNLGPSVERLVELTWPEPRRTERQVEGEVLYSDRFGNVVTNVPRELLQDVAAEAAQVAFSGQTLCGIRRTYGHVGGGEGVALFDSSDLLEIAVRDGDAADRFHLRPGDRIVVTW